MPRRKRRSTRRSRTNACFNRRMVKNNRMRTLCKFMGRANCIRKDGTSKKGKRCRTKYLQLLRR